MRIKVLYNYGGAMTHEARIQPGEYDIDAPELFGAGRYLVENGHATVIENDTPPEPTPAPHPPTVKPTPPDRRQRK